MDAPTTNSEYGTISVLFGVGLSTVHITHARQYHSTCFQNMLVPREERLKEIMSEFDNLWGFPHVANFHKVIARGPD